jgi:hypothetical protein
MAARHALLTVLCLVATVSASGCRAVGFNNPIRKGGSETLPASLTVQEAVDAINQNARSVNSLQARTAITATLGGRRTTLLAAPVSGNILMQRPRNFRLMLKVGPKEIADLGSNSQGFWFWFAGNDPAIYTCKYDADGQIPAGVPVTFQPDWILEALGLREISDEDAKNMTIRRGNIVGTDVLIGRRQTPSGESYQRMIWINSSTKRVVAYRLYGPGSQALTEASLQYDLVTTNESEPTLPHKVRLAWIKEDMVLDVSLSRIDTKAVFRNPELSFAEPEMHGIERRDLGAMAAAYGGRGRTTIRESRPIPPLGSEGTTDGSAARVRLGNPAPIGTDGAFLRRSDPRPLDADLPALPGSPDGLVQNAIPRPPTDAGTAAVAADPRWRSSATSLER